VVAENRILSLKNTEKDYIQLKTDNLEPFRPLSDEDRLHGRLEDLWDSLTLSQQ
jgi:hypothetical protein